MFLIRMQQFFFFRLLYIYYLTWSIYLFHENGCTAFYNNIIFEINMLFPSFAPLPPLSSELLFWVLFITFILMIFLKILTDFVLFVYSYRSMHAYQSVFIVHHNGTTGKDSGTLTHKIVSSPLAGLATYSTAQNYYLSSPARRQDIPIFLQPL